MTKLIQILLVAFAAQWFGVYGKPLFQGVSFQRGFDINFKPLPRKPISFIMEKWSPLGVFGRKHAIQKRSSDSEPMIVQRPAAPVFEHEEEQERTDTLPLKVLPPQTPRTLLPVPISSPMPPPLLSSAVPPLNVIITPPPKPGPSDVLPSSIIPNTVELLPAKPIPSDILLQSPVPVQGGSLPTNIILPPTKSINSDVPPSGLFTDISRAEAMREYLNSVQSDPQSLTDEVEKVSPQLETNSIQTESPKNNVVLNENSLVRGSKLALYYGSVFLQLMSQFLTNARATFDQMTNPPPVYNN